MNRADWLLLAEYLRDEYKSYDETSESPASQATRGILISLSLVCFKMAEGLTEETKP